MKESPLWSYTRSIYHSRITIYIGLFSGGFQTRDAEVGRVSALHPELFGETRDQEQMSVGIAGTFRKADAILSNMDEAASGLDVLSRSSTDMFT
jgi:hypothetical protein